jgi:hypothetical protein
MPIFVVNSQPEGVLLLPKAKTASAVLTCLIFANDAAWNSQTSVTLVVSALSNVNFVFLSVVMTFA